MVVIGYRLTRSGVFTEPVLNTVLGFEIPPLQDSETPTSCSPWPPSTSTNTLVCSRCARRHRSIAYVYNQKPLCEAYGDEVVFLAAYGACIAYEGRVKFVSRFVRWLWQCNFIWLAERNTLSKCSFQVTNSKFNSTSTYLDAIRWCL